MNYKKLVQEYLDNGGSVTQCPQGAYEGQHKGWGDPAYGKPGNNLSADAWHRELTKDRDLDKRGGNK